MTDLRTSVLERMARASTRASYTAVIEGLGISEQEIGLWVEEHWRGSDIQMSAILSALTAADSPVMLVPKRATDNMLDAMDRAHGDAPEPGERADSFDPMRAAYHAALSASPFAEPGR